MNAFFLTDANALDTDDPVQAVENAVKQGAFIMWNHPGWPDRQVTMYDVHRKLIDEGKIHGIELINGPRIPSQSDRMVQREPPRLHVRLGRTPAHHRQVRPFAHAAPDDARLCQRAFGRGIKEALFARRSAVMFHDLLIGPAEPGSAR